jgi:hypothetical protein
MGIIKPGPTLRFEIVTACPNSAFVSSSSIVFSTCSHALAVSLYEKFLQILYMIKQLDTVRQ